MGRGIKEGWREGKVREKCNYIIVPKIKVKKNVERQRQRMTFLFLIFTYKTEPNTKCLNLSWNISVLMI